MMHVFGFLYDQPRKYQLWEEFFSTSPMYEPEPALAPAQSSRLQSDERWIFLGQSRPRALALVSPDLEEYVATNHEERASVLKERRKTQEERRTADADKTQQPTGDRHHRGCGGKGAAAEEG